MFVCVFLLEASRVRRSLGFFDLLFDPEKMSNWLSLPLDLLSIIFSLTTTEDSYGHAKERQNTSARVATSYRPHSGSTTTLESSADSNTSNLYSNTPANLSLPSDFEATTESSATSEPTNLNTIDGDFVDLESADRSPDDFEMTELSSTYIGTISDILSTETVTGDISAYLEVTEEVPATSSTGSASTFLEATTAGLKQNPERISKSETTTETSHGKTSPKTTNRIKKFNFLVVLIHRMSIFLFFKESQAELKRPSVANSRGFIYIKLLLILLFAFTIFVMEPHQMLLERCGRVKGEPILLLNDKIVKFNQANSS